MDTNVNSNSNSKNTTNNSIFSRSCKNIMSFPKRFKDKIVDFTLTAKKIAKDDPKKIIHALKVALAVTIVSLFYYFQPLYDGFGVSAMWAVLTVVVIFEYTVGATLGKGCNRMVATCVAGFLGVLAHHVANLSGEIGEPIVLGIFGFIVAGIMTFMRFIPKLKAKYDYGLMIFTLTFSLVSVSGFRDDEVLKIEQQRLSTIIIGCWIAILISICISPVWNGTQLHFLITSNIHKLGIFLEGFGDEYFKTTEEKSDSKFSRDVYKSVLGSKSTEESNANLAAWEPSHGQFRYRHPWKQYVKIGALTRECAYKIDALNNHLDSNVQTPREIEDKIKKPCIKLSIELGKSLKEISSEMKEMKKANSSQKHVNKSKEVAQELKSLLQNQTLWENFNVLNVLNVATISSLLIEIVNDIDNIVVEVNELANMANFKSTVNSVNVDQELQGNDHLVVTINDVPEVDNLSLQKGTNGII